MKCRKADSRWTYSISLYMSPANCQDERTLALFTTPNHDVFGIVEQHVPPVHLGLYKASWCLKQPAKYCCFYSLWWKRARVAKKVKRNIEDTLAHTTLLLHTSSSFSNGGTRKRRSSGREWGDGGGFLLSIDCLKWPPQSIYGRTGQPPPKIMSEMCTLCRCYMGGVLGCAISLSVEEREWQE